ncbi:uncharacterized protein flap isoform X4 [Drosophila bipectinata]|uniref:uncharacterized protein flap isoform X4 n=1 Tax=Drosophila bipectinata TaxID=42026 RepID=UPI001C8AE748|nr:uncharacterized protein LOC108125179 isoform X4 [Drosophila bipectinata]
MQIDSQPRRRSGFTIITLLLIIKAVAGRPDVRESPFARNLQPPLLQQDESFNGGGSSGRAVDSYGNPIDALRPIDTPDGRKVVSAQGVQFEIPTYASGITEIRRPADDLLPPHIARLDPQASIGSPNTNPSPNSIGGEQFPPFGTAGGKVEYTKSDEGKVISTPVVANNQRKTESATPPSSSSNSGKYTGGFGAPPGLLRPQSASNAVSGSASGSQADIYVAGNQHEFSQVAKANKARPTVNPGRYTGGFGAPSGVLAPQAEPRPFQHHSVQQPQHQLQQAASTEHRQREQSRFGGPPGILVPFDNVQRTGGQ